MQTNCTTVAWYIYNCLFMPDAQFRKLRSLKTLASFKNGTFYDKSTEQMKEIRELGVSFSVYFCFNIVFK